MSDWCDIHTLHTHSLPHSLTHSHSHLPTQPPTRPPVHPPTPLPLIHGIIILFADSASVDRVVKSSNTVIEGDTFSLTCEVSGDPEPNVTWITVSNDEHSYGNILKFTNITRGDSGKYTCETTNSCGDESRNESINVFCKF